MITIFAINPGSTSTKIGLFEGSDPIFIESIRHKKQEISLFPKIIEQLDFRKKKIEEVIEEKGINTGDIDYFIGRGGILKPLKSGLYEVCDKMISDLREARYGEHASNLGAILAEHFARRHGKHAYILDPVCVDEFEPVSRITGHPLFKRKSIFHALNHKKTARNAADKISKRYEEINLIVTHMGGGISVGLHKKGKIVDVNNAIVGEGPFTPERTGGLPLADFAEYIIDNELCLADVKKMIAGKGGLSAYFNTTDFDIIMQRYNKGDKKAAIVIEAMAYQIAKEIAAMATGVNGEVDAIAFTGGLANSRDFIDLIKKRISFITSDIYVFPGEDELLAMAEGVLNHIEGKVAINEY